VLSGNASDGDLVEMCSTYLENSVGVVTITLGPDNRVVAILDLKNNTASVTFLNYLE